MTDSPHLYQCSHFVLLYLCVFVWVCVCACVSVVCPQVSEYACVSVFLWKPEVDVKCYLSGAVHLVKQVLSLGPGLLIRIGCGSAWYWRHVPPPAFYVDARSLRYDSGKNDDCLERSVSLHLTRLLKQSISENWMSHAGKRKRLKPGITLQERLEGDTAASVPGWVNIDQGCLIMYVSSLLFKHFPCVRTPKMDVWGGECLWISVPISNMTTLNKSFPAFHYYLFNCLVWLLCF